MIKRREIGDANASHRCAQQVGQKVYVDWLQTYDKLSKWLSSVGSFYKSHGEW